MKYSVPQFIDVEDKVVGPLTIRQFSYLLGGSIVLILIWAFTGFSAVFFLLALPVVGISSTFAFLKINGRPFQYFLLSFIGYATKGARLWVWRRTGKKAAFQVEEAPKEDKTKMERVFPKSHIRQLVEVLDTGMSTKATADLETMKVAQRVRASGHDMQR
jgi:hypothetical protein